MSEVLASSWLCRNLTNSALPSVQKVLMQHYSQYTEQQFNRWHSNSFGISGLKSAFSRKLGSLRNLRLFLCILGLHDRHFQRNWKTLLLKSIIRNQWHGYVGSTQPLHCCKGTQSTHKRVHKCSHCRVAQFAWWQIIVCIFFASVWDFTYKGMTHSKHCKVQAYEVVKCYDESANPKCCYSLANKHWHP